MSLQETPFAPPADAVQGQLAALTQTNGSFTAGNGLDAQGSYRLDYSTTTTSTTWDDSTLVWNVGIAKADDADGHKVELETSPRRMRVDGSIWFVPIDE